MELDAETPAPVGPATSAAELVGMQAETLALDITWMEKEEAGLRLKWQAIKDAARGHGVPEEWSRQLDNVVSETQRLVLELQGCNLRALKLAAQCMIVTARSPVLRPIIYAPRGQQREPTMAAIRTDNPVLPIPGPLGLVDDVFSVPICPLLYDEAEGDIVPQDVARTGTDEA
jgi:hypothetical protein